MYTHQYQQALAAAPTPSTAPRSTGWQTNAIAAHHRSQLDEAALRRKLAAAVHALTGRSVEHGAIVVDLPGRAAFARVDGVRVRWASDELFVVRPCAHCGLGAIASPPVRTTEELGFALGDWQPFHEDCRPFEADAIE